MSHEDKVIEAHRAIEEVTNNPCTPKKKIKKSLQELKANIEALLENL